MNTTTKRPPIAFSAPAQQELLQAYGDPRSPGWESQWMTLWRIQESFSWFPKPALYLHKDFKTILQKAFDSLQLRDLHHEIRSCDGCFNIRHVRGSYSVLSVHSWGAAIDLNARDNPLGTAGRWSAGFLQTMTDCGIFSGQLWTGRKDPMHFAMVNG